MKKGAFGLALKFVREGGQLKEVDRIEIPPVGARDLLQFLLGFREGDVESGFPQTRTLQEKLKRYRGFPHAWITLQQINAVARQAAPDDVVQANNARVTKVRQFG